MKPLGLNLVISTALVALGLAACSDGADTRAGAQSAPTSSKPASSVAPSSAPSSPASSAAHAAGPINVCTAVPLATVVSVTGRGYSEAHPATATAGGFRQTSCVYKHGTTSDADGLQLVIAVVRGADPRGVFASMDEVLGDMKPDSAAGDSAQSDDTELDVAWGKDVVIVQDDLYPGTTRALSRAVFTALAEKAHQAL